MKEERCWEELPPLAKIGENFEEAPCKGEGEETSFQSMRRGLELNL